MVGNMFETMGRAFLPDIGVEQTHQDEIHLLNPRHNLHEATDEVSTEDINYQLHGLYKRWAGVSRGEVRYCARVVVHVLV